MKLFQLPTSTIVHPDSDSFGLSGVLFLWYPTWLIHWACWMSWGVRVPPVLLWLVATKGVLCKAGRDIGGGNFLRPSLDHQENNHNQLHGWSIWGLGLCLANGLPWFPVSVRADVNSADKRPLWKPFGGCCGQVASFHCPHHDWAWDPTDCVLSLDNS